MALITQPGVASSQDAIPGAGEFLNSCSACHGSDGRGSGPVAAYLTVKPPDLTRLSERNNGQFPFLRIFMIIDGRTGVRSHGTESMPVWGDRYRQQIDPKNANPQGTEQVIRGRILELVNYLASIQLGADKTGIVR
jgi:mono/diheme cytochrome c family protein